LRLGFVEKKRIEDLSFNEIKQSLPQNILIGYLIAPCLTLHTNKRQAGFKLLHVVDYVLALVEANDPFIDLMLITKIKKDNKCLTLLGHSLYAFFLYPCNNIVHCKIQDTLFAIFQRKNVILKRFLMTKFRLLEWIMLELKNSKTNSKFANHGHLIEIANSINENNYEILNSLEQILVKSGKDKSVIVNWREFEKTALAKLNQDRVQKFIIPKRPTNIISYY